MLHSHLGPLLSNVKLLVGSQLYHCKCTAGVRHIRIPCLTQNPGKSSFHV